MDFETVLEKLSAFYTSKDFAEEIYDARREFFENAGVVDEESDLYEVRMAQFLDWYLFSRDLKEKHVPPIVDAVRTGAGNWAEPEQKILNSLLNHRHSLFELVKIKDQDMTVKDLFEGDKIEVKNSPWIYGIDKKALFEARVAVMDSQFFFFKGICLHPVEARKFILDEIKNCRDVELQDRRLLMLRLMKLRYKFELYKHVNFEDIYSENEKFRV